MERQFPVDSGVDSFTGNYGAAVSANYYARKSIPHELLVLTALCRIVYPYFRLIQPMYSPHQDK